MTHAPVQSSCVSAPDPTAYFDLATETLDRSELRGLQLRRLQDLVDEILPRNAFYARKLGGRRQIAGWDDFGQLPFTTKSEIAEDQARHPPFGSDLTYPL